MSFSKTKKARHSRDLLHLMGLTGLEPVTPALSTQCSNQLSYRPSFYAYRIKANDGNRTRIASLEGWNSTIELHSQILCRIHSVYLWRWTESNRRHYELQSYALPTELQRHLSTAHTKRSQRGSNPRSPA